MLRRTDGSTDHPRLARHLTLMATLYSDGVNRQLASVHSRYVYPGEAAADAPPMPRVVHQHFTVAHEAAALQLPAWRDYVGRILDVPISRTQLATGFRGAIDTYVLGNMIYLDSRTSPVAQARTAERISSDNVRDFVFHVAVDGIVETTTGAPRQRKAAQFTPGVLALDMNQQMRMERPTQARVLAFFLPRAMVEAAIPDAESIHGSVATYTSPLTRLLRRQLTALCQSLPGMPDAEAEHALRTCADLLVAAFGKQTRLNDGARAALRAAVLDQVKHYIQANLQQAELSPESIFRVFQLPRATLYRMFQPEGGLGTYIRNCRLREAAHELIRFPQKTVIETAYGLGFDSHPGFTRAFRRAYGMTPQDFRGLGLDVLRW